MGSPIGTYCSPEITQKKFCVDLRKSRYNTTDGTTTGASEYVLNAGQIDRDRPADPKISMSTGDATTLSKLRMELTGIQDDINEFLTERMEIAKNKKLKTHSIEDEKRIDNEIKGLLDGGDDDDSVDDN